MAIGTEALKLKKILEMGNIRRGNIWFYPMLIERN